MSLQLLSNSEFVQISPILINVLPSIRIRVYDLWMNVSNKLKLSEATCISILGIQVA
jgi:hypothetical protein